MAEKESRPFLIPMTGKWRPAIDGTQMADGDFQTLTNMRYTEGTGVRTIAGMTKINSAAPTNLNFRSGYHFTKARPAESHVLVQATSGTAGVIYDNTTAIPNTGAFAASSIFTETTSPADGNWSPGPDGSVLYTNEKETCVWGGNEARCPAFFVGDATDILTTAYDYTEAVNNDLTTAANVATLQIIAGSSYVYIGALRPLKGIKFYVGTANTAAATAAVDYWDGSAWTAVSGAADGTSSGGKTLAQTGSITFTSTLSTAKTRVMSNTYLYWYQVTFASISAGTTVYQCTLDAPFQPLVDIWDGVPRGVQHFLKLSNNGDETTRVFAQDYNAADATTYSNLSSLVTTTTFYVGFVNRMTAIQFGIATGAGNSNANTPTINYWNGTTWVSVGTLVDQTDVAGATLGQAGWISWNPPAVTAEFKRSVAGGPLLYYYYITFSGTLSATVHLDYVFGIPAQQTILPHHRVATWQNRVVLIGEVNGKRNSLLIGSYGGVAGFNGTDVLEINNVGDDSTPTAVGALFTRYTGAFYDTLVLCKNKEVWVLDGLSVTDYHLFKISDIYGCVAPKSFQVAPVAYELTAGINRHIAIWQTATGVVMFDGNTINPIDEDIRNYFNPIKSECINASYIDKSVSWVDEREKEYHLIIASGSSSTGPDTELVYSLRKKGWFLVSRGLNLQCGISVTSTLGARYVYGGTSTGFLERLENGNTFDGTAIAATLKTKDYPLPPLGWTGQTYIRHVKLLTLVKSTSNNITLSHFGDCSTTADSTTVSMSPNVSGKRVAQVKAGVTWGANTFHSFQATMSTSDLSSSFEPIGLSFFYDDVRRDI